MSNIIIGAIAIIVGAGLGYGLRIWLTRQKIDNAEKEANKILAKAKEKLAGADAQGKELILNAKEAASKIRDRIDKEEKERRRELSDLEKRLITKDENLDKKMEDLERQKEAIIAKDKEILEVREEILKIRDNQKAKLEEIAKLTEAKAKEQLFARLEKEYKEEALKMIKDIEAEAKETADDKAREIISASIQRYAAEVATEGTTFSVALPSDDIKGRIIGKEGRNIQAFEKASGVDVIIDDTPDVVTISCFDPIRRHIAKRALERLVKDGRIQPARIEEVLEKAEAEINQEIKKAGEAAVMELGLTGLHPDLIKIIGRLQFRTSYGQNILKHSIETAHLAALMAQQLGMKDIRLVKLTALMHDIGKALDHEYEGSHIELSRDIAKKYGLPEELIHALEISHEGFGGPTTQLDFITMAADAISASRPGARRESAENFVKRLEDLEKIATSYEGVAKAYAIQAGREIRIMVQPDKIDDLAAAKMAREVARQIEKEMTYPGQVKVMIIRETRAEDVAK
ncbi:ribonuclease Y [candidate division Kazan bacterium]|uniref:Ribonuclease Y n=1 Tax=candidate division Kazan bacterium TaxID=2202143 RepID=A0A420ZDM7_UNCK3|nr:MAG: ribonuclease Y [candidate division Kazan bacterium]